MGKFFSKILTSSSRKKEAIEEITRLVAEGKITPKDTEMILSKKSLDISDISKDLLSFVEDLIKEKYRPNLPKESYIKINQEIASLINSLKLPGETGKALLANLSREYLTTYVVKLISDGELDDVKEKEITGLSEVLGIEKVTENSILEEARKKYINNYFNSMIADRRISEEEYEKFKIVKKSLSVNVTFDAKTEELINKFRLLWQIENNMMPIIANPGIILQKQEFCYYIVTVEWYEHRKQTSGISYGGLTYRKKIAGGLYFRAGSLGIKPISQDVLMQIDKGSVFLTNKRMIFTGVKGNKTIAYNSILDIEPFNNGVQITRSTGKSPFLKFEDDPEVFSTILSQILSSQ